MGGIAAAATALPFSGTPSPSRASAPGSPAVSLNFNISGITDNGFAQRLMEALRNNSSQFERIVAEIVHNQERRAYG